jgi:hypothetical protein
MLQRFELLAVTKETGDADQQVLNRHLGRHLFERSEQASLS